jgi:SAM-dependent methyltransferase
MADFIYEKAARAVRSALGMDRRSRWNKQFAEGGWEWLKNLEELAHHSVLIGYLQRLAPGGRVLDMGCGNGMLVRGVSSKPWSDYIGIDFEEPIKHCADLVDDVTTFATGDMNDYVPTGTFDAIIFNESAYYHWDAVKGFQRYVSYLNPGGVLLISMVHNAKSPNIWAAIEPLWPTLDSVYIKNSKGTEWTVKAIAAGPEEKE